MHGLDAATSFYEELRHRAWAEGFTRPPPTPARGVAPSVVDCSIAIAQGPESGASPFLAYPATG